MEKEILLDVQHLSVGFESYNAKVEKVIFNAISDLSLTVHKGEIVAIVGSSGSGKSLLAHAVMNILPDNARTGGTMFYKGELLTPERMNRLRGHEIAFIPQSVAFLDPLMQAEFFKLILEYNAKGTTCFLSSHVLSEIRKYCKRAAIIREGELILQLVDRRY